MEYETYDTDATYDEMYEEGAKGEVCRGNCTKRVYIFLSSYEYVCWQFSSFNFSKVTAGKKERKRLGESSAERENWVELNIWFLSLVFFIFSEKEADLPFWFDYFPAACSCSPTKCVSCCLCLDG